MDILVYVIALAVLAILSFVGFMVISKQNNLLANKKLIFYYFLIAIIFTATGFIGLISSSNNDIWMWLLILQALSLGLGFLVHFLWKKNTLAEIGDSKSVLSGILFFSANALLGMIGFCLLFYYCNKVGFATLYMWSIVPFVLPHFISVSFNYFVSIPQEVHKIWYFPVDGGELDLRNVDMNNVLMLELEYSKTINDPRLTNTKLRAPMGMKFGDWFQAFIEDWNYKYDNDPIQFVNDDQTAQGWIFYTKPSFLGVTKFIDPDLTISQNNLTEKKTIFVRRVGFSEDENL